MNPVGAWLKVVGGRRFVVRLYDDFRLVEALEEDPQDTWSGTWSFGSTDEKALYPLRPTVGLHIGPFLTMLAFKGPDLLVGIERNSDTNPRLVMPNDYEEYRVELIRQNEISRAFRSPSAR